MMSRPFETTSKIRFSMGGMSLSDAFSGPEAPGARFGSSAGRNLASRRGRAGGMAWRRPAQDPTPTPGSEVGGRAPSLPGALGVHGSGKLSWPSVRKFVIIPWPINGIPAGTRRRDPARGGIERQ